MRIALSTHLGFKALNCMGELWFIGPVNTSSGLCLLFIGGGKGYSRAMSGWQERASLQQDVACFNYAKSDLRCVKEAYIWDLDKTYLDTKFESLRGLLKVILEEPVRKKNVPGTADLVRCLKEAWEDKHGDAKFPIVYMTASPPQMESKILKKLNWDGIEPVFLFCKDNLKNLTPRRFWRLTKQVGYKLQALLQMRLHFAEDVRQILWGDDSESDALIYCLYSDICMRRLSHGELSKTLKTFSVVGEQLDEIFKLQEQIPIHDPVGKIYINLQGGTDAEYYAKFGRRVVPTSNSFQSTLDLFQDKIFESKHVVDIGKALALKFSFTQDQLEKSFDDLVRRGILGSPAVNEILPVLKENNLIHEDFQPSV